MKIQSHPQGGMSLFGVLVVIALIAILALLLIPSALHDRNSRLRRRDRIICVNNLKQIGVAARIWSNEHDREFPSASMNSSGTLAFANSPQVFRHYLALSNELISPKLLVCPADKKRPKAADFGKFSNANLSYFVGLDAREDSPNSVLSGDRNITGGTLSNGFLRTFTPASNDAGWTTELHNNAGNAGLGDGSVQQLNGNRLRLHLTNMTDTSIRLAIP
jgi:type II secretory pathway pseudopilin PulG